MLKKVVATIEARLSSTRLPQKVLKPICGIPMLGHIIQRLQACQQINEIIVASTTASEDSAIAQFCEQQQVKCFRGSVDNITQRLLDATENSNADIILQATGDNPFIDPNAIASILDPLKNGNADYAGNHFGDTLPLGLELRAFTRNALEKVALLTEDPIDLVHGSYFIYTHPEIFRLRKVEPVLPSNVQKARLTVDTQADFDLAEKIFEVLYPKHHIFDTQQIMDTLQQKPELLDINQHIRQKAAAEG